MEKDDWHDAKDRSNPTYMHNFLFIINPFSTDQYVFVHVQHDHLDKDARDQILNDAIVNPMLSYSHFDLIKQEHLFSGHLLVVSNNHEKPQADSVFEHFYKQIHLPLLLDV